MWSRRTNLLILFLLAQTACGYHVVGYYPAWAVYGRNYLITDIPVEQITHLNYAFANIVNGEIALGDPYADTDLFYPGDCWDPGCERGNFHQLRILKEQHPTLKTLISVGGWSWSDYFSDVALNDASRELFAASCAEFIVLHGFDGVDLDWEYPDGGGEGGNIERPEDAANFILLCARIRHKLDSLEALDGHARLLTMALGASQAHITALEWISLAPLLDLVNVMCYDFSGAWSGTTLFDAPLFPDPANPIGEPVRSTFNSSSAMQTCIAEGIPRAKIVMGMPFYGKGYANVGDNDHGVYQPFSGVSPHGTWQNGFYDYSDLTANYVNQNGYTRYVHPVTHAPYLHNPAANVFITYDDTASIREKCQYIVSESLGGAMFWEITGDREAALMNEINSVFAATVPAPQSLTVFAAGDSLYFRWNPVPGAAHYSLWSSADPQTPHGEYTLELVTQESSATLLLSNDPLRVFHVTAE
ncbi:MAG: glycoside hydrolase family 18 protein [Calditrichaeota bacterium]|nr:glycoside hydrolase family 18 protein [Calditrichota bacterium]